MPVQTRRQSLSLSNEQQSNNISSDENLKSKQGSPKQAVVIKKQQRPKRKRRQSGGDNLKDAEPQQKRVRKSSTGGTTTTTTTTTTSLEKILNQIQIQNNNTKNSNFIMIEGQKYFQNDFVYIRMQEISDEEEFAIQKCLICNQQINEGNDEVKTCCQCARVYHENCLKIHENSENFENNVENNNTLQNKYDKFDVTWTCEKCVKCDNQSEVQIQIAGSLCERIVDGEQSVFLAQIIEFIFENEEQFVRLRWIYSINSNAPEILSWKKINYEQKLNQKNKSVVNHCKCIFLGADPEGVSNEPAAVIIRKANVVFELKKFIQLLKKGCDVFLCIGEFQMDDEKNQEFDQNFADQNILSDDEKESNFFSDDSMEDEEFDFRFEKRKSLNLTPQNRNRRRRSQGGENIRNSLLEKFSKNVNISLNFDSDSNKNQTNNKNNQLEQAKQNLALNFHPEELPCRDLEKKQIKDFICSAMNGKNGCLYISGIPGTGKTATVREVIRVLQNNHFKFDFFEFNGLKLPNPKNLYTQFCEKVCNIKTSQQKSQQAIEDYFTNLQQQQYQQQQNTQKIIPKIILVDEIDMLITKNQQILYNLFEWPLRPYSCMSVITISNTMDLPERLLPRIQSRLTNSRLIFKPYKSQDIEIIIKYRLNKYINIYDYACIKIVASKVGTLAGDVRKALELLKRGTELAYSEGKERVESLYVQNAIKELYADPHLQYVCNASILQKLILASIILQKQYGNSGEQQSNGANKYKMSLQAIVSRAKNFCQSYSIKIGGGAIKNALWNLESVGLISLSPKGACVQGTVKLNVLDENVVFMLKQDTSIQLFATLSV